MRSTSRTVLRSISTLVSFLSFGSAASAAALSVGSAGPPPEDLSPALRAELVPGGVRAATETAAIEIWLRREPPAANAKKEGLGINFGTIPEGALVGVLRLPASWTDYRGSKVPAGLYALRFAIEPADGYHMGVSAYRDFLLLVPAGQDPGPGETLSFADLVKLAKKTTAGHPGVLALFPHPAVQQPAAGMNELGQPVLALPFGPLTLGLVVQGTGEV